MNFVTATAIRMTEIDGCAPSTSKLVEINQHLQLFTFSKLTEWRHFNASQVQQIHAT